VGTERGGAGKTERGWVGVGSKERTDDLAGAMDLGGLDGVGIGGVSDDSPEGRAGLEPGDLVRALDGEPIRRTSDFRNRIAWGGAGHPFEMEVLRKGRTKRLSGTLGTHPGDVVQSETTLGLTFTQNEGAWVVEGVEKGSPASRAGLRAGDRVLAIDGKKATDVRLRGGLERGRMLLLVERDGIQRFVVLKNP